MKKLGNNAIFLVFLLLFFPGKFLHANKCLIFLKRVFSVQYRKSTKENYEYFLQRMNSQQPWYSTLNMLGRDRELLPRFRSYSSYPLRFLKDPTALRLMKQAAEKATHEGLTKESNDDQLFARMKKVFQDSISRPAGTNKTTDETAILRYFNKHILNKPESWNILFERISLEGRVISPEFQGFSKNPTTFLKSSDGAKLLDSLITKVVVDGYGANDIENAMSALSEAFIIKITELNPGSRAIDINIIEFED